MEINSKNSKNRLCRKRDDAGFTLIEVAIVALIGGVMLATASALLLTYIKKVQISTTERRIAAIDEALELFLSLNGRYPCAAPLNAPIDSANFGREVSASQCNTEAAVAGETTRVSGVRIGAVPVRTINLPDDFIADAWSGRFTYAVTERLATPGSYDRDEGAISVVDRNNNSVITPEGSGHYVVVSHGANNSGATALGGGGVTPCTAGTLEAENCNGTATFRRTMLAGTANNAEFYDDMISVRASTSYGNQVPAGAVVAFDLAACPEGWVPYRDADDRVIFGAGFGAGAPYAVGDTGGKNEWRLNEIGLGVTTTPIDPTVIPGTATFIERASPIVNNAHENRPRYIALLYCQKS